MNSPDADFPGLAEGVEMGEGLVLACSPEPHDKALVAGHSRFGCSCDPECPCAVLQFSSEGGLGEGGLIGRQGQDGLKVRLGLGLAARESESQHAAGETQDSKDLVR